MWIRAIPKYESYRFFASPSELRRVRQQEVQAVQRDDDHLRGSRLPAVNSISSRMFARKLNRENTNPSIDEIHSVNSTAGTAMMIVLTKYLPQVALLPGRRRSCRS